MVMPEAVRCDVCGGLFSSRHLSSHKRLSHGIKNAAQVPARATSDQEAMSRIVELFADLSDENKKNVLYRLTVPRKTQ